MFALPPPPRHSQDALVQARIVTLVDLGYLMAENGKWFLTEKGWRTLSAAAESRAAPSRPTRAQIEREILETKLTDHKFEMMLHR